MREPLAPKERPILTAHEPHPSPGEARRGEGPRYVVGVRFYRRMKVQRVYPMVVNVSPTAGHLQGIKSHTPPLEIRPVLPGAQVTPSHYEMETTGSTPAFYVTPLARGKLADARLEVYSHGRLVQEIPLPMKGTRQRSTWILLLLAVLIPLGLYYFTRHVNLSSTAGTVQAKAAVKAQAEPGEEEDGKAMSDEELDKAQIEGMARMGQTPPPGGLRRDQGAKKPAAKVEGQAQEPKPEFTPLPKVVGPVEQATINVLPEFFIGHKTETITRYDSEGKANPVTTKQPFSVTKWLAAQVQGGYDGIQNLSLDVYPSFYVGLGLLALAVISWFFHAGRRSSRRGQPIALGA